GLDYEPTDYVLETQFGPQKVDQKIWGIYGQTSVPVNKNWEISAGLRYTEVDNRISANGDSERLDDHITLGSLALDYDAGGPWRFFVRADQNFRFAKVDEHTNVVFGHPIGIDNQRGISYETGVAWSRADINLNLTAYRLDLDDEISFSSDGFTNINLDETRRLGLTAEAVWQVRPGWTLGAEYTYTDTEITAGAFEGNRVPLVAEHNARAWTEGRIGENLTGFAEVSYLGDRVLGGDFNNDFGALDAYAVFNAAITYELQGWRIRARVDNLFGEEYEASGAVGFNEEFALEPAFFPAPEQRFTLTARYDF
ncbi:MAG: TonB-dependent receptor, partial [Pseudomonadota bacterium]